MATDHATETVLSNQPPTLEGEKEKLNEEVKPIEQAKHIEEPPASLTDLTDTADKPDDKPVTVPITDKPDDKPVTVPITDLTPDDKPVTVPITEDVVKTENNPVPLEEYLEVPKDSVHEPEIPSVPATEEPNVVDVPISSSKVETPEVSPSKEPEAVTVKEIEVAGPDYCKEEKTVTETPLVEEKTNVADEKIELKVPKVEEELLEPEPVAEEKIELKVPKVEEQVLETEPVTVGVKEEPEPATVVAENAPEPVIAALDDKLEPAGQEKAEILITEVEEKPNAAVPVVEDKQEPVVTPELESKSEEILIEKEQAVPEVDKVEPVTVVKVTEETEAAVPIAEEIKERSLPEAEEKPAETQACVVEEKKEPVVPEAAEKPVTAALEVEENTAPVLPVVEEKPDREAVEQKPEPVVPVVEEKTLEQHIAGEAGKGEKIESNGTTSEEQEKINVPAPDPIRDVSVASSTEVTASSAEEESKPRDVELIPENEDNRTEKENVVPAPIVSETDKTYEVPKEELPSKPKSTTILSKVKKSIVKAKKAILGKSPSTKTITTTPTETKEDPIAVSEVVKQ